MFWDFQQEFSDLGLWFWCNYPQVRSFILAKGAYHRNLKLMDCKEPSVLRPWLRLFRPWSVILVCLKLKLIDLKELLRFSARFFRLWSAILGHLWTNQQIDPSKVIYNRKLRLTDCKELIFPRLSARLFTPLSVIFSQLFISKWTWQKLFTIQSWDWWRWSGVG